MLDKRKWLKRFEYAAFFGVILIPPFFLERWYGLNLLLGIAAMAAIVVPGDWLYERARQRRQGLPLTFSAYLRRLLPGG
jgi:hypothetical protein